jgi:hypothetical protein
MMGESHSHKVSDQLHSQNYFRSSTDGVMLVNSSACVSVMKLRKIALHAHNALQVVSLAVLVAATYAFCTLNFVCMRMCSALNRASSLSTTVGGTMSRRCAKTTANLVTTLARCCLRMHCYHQYFDLPLLHQNFSVKQ